MIVYLPRLLASLAVLGFISAPIGAFGVFLLGFAITHDAAHGSLGLSRRATGLVLAVGGIAIGTSGHALRLMHMRHHARELAPDDLEGSAARMSFFRALIAAPCLARTLHVTAWRAATGRDRRWQLAEYAGLVALVAGALVGPRQLAVYTAVALGMQLFAPWWAGHIPHRANRLRALASRVARFGSLTLASLAHHELHHRRPKVPTWRLAAFAAASISEE